MPQRSAPPAGDTTGLARRRQILRAAATVFARKGFHQARMDDVVAESGLSKGAIYWYFPGKDHIAAALADELLAEETRREAAIYAGPGTVRERLDTYLERLALSTREDPASTVLMLELLTLAQRSDEIGITLRRHYRSCVDLLVALVRDGAATGELAVADPEAAGRALASALYGVLMVWMLDPETGDLLPRLREAAFAVLPGRS